MNSLFVYRPRATDAIVQRLAEQRQNEFSHLSILDIVFLGRHITCHELEKARNADVPQSREAAQDFDFFKEWHGQCKRLKGNHRALFAFEGAIHIAALSIPDDQARKDWIASCERPLASLKAVLTPNTNQPVAEPVTEVTPIHHQIPPNPDCPQALRNIAEPTSQITHKRRLEPEGNGMPLDKRARTDGPGDNGSIGSDSASQTTPFEERWRSDILNSLPLELSYGEVESVRNSLQHMAPLSLSDLHRNIFQAVGSPYSVSDIVGEFLKSSESAEFFRVEQLLGLKQTTCLVVEVPSIGDVDVKWRVSRKKAMDMVTQYGLLVHHVS
ncbi:hypothetical protein BKA56DRAFT_662663 [Ilyonectria sp. MPI-CAGE-AT-0026]|nr:hypothetical protein BKA56DRAFT_662663 [Ilyonectria sp. MPI-CAGE-AT-0026]